MDFITKAMDITVRLAEIEFELFGYSVSCLEIGLYFALLGLLVLLYGGLFS